MLASARWVVPLLHEWPARPAKRFSPRSSISPQVGHTWLRTKRLFSTLALRITALLAGVRGIYHHHHLLTGVCCFVGKDGAELPPARIADALLARCGLRTRLATRRS